jgi:SAM-dependent methyltransferase
MVDQARLKPAAGKVVYLQGSAEALPFRDACADLVFISMVFHHFAAPTAVARECRRVLRQGGHSCIRNTTRENDFPHRHFFPALWRLVESALPAREEIRSTFAASGFILSSHQVVAQIVAPDWSSFVEKSALRADSFLARLSDSDFQEGMAARRSHSEEIDRRDPVTEEVDWFVFTTPP